MNELGNALAIAATFAPILLGCCYGRTSKPAALMYPEPAAVAAGVAEAKPRPIAYPDRLMPQAGPQRASGANGED